MCCTGIGSGDSDRIADGEIPADMIYLDIIGCGAVDYGTKQKKK